MWFLEKLVPGSAAHNLTRAYSVTGELDVDALRAGWRAVVARHEILRTTFVEVHGEPVQQIAEHGDDSVILVDFGAAHSPVADARSYVTELAATPFDLAAGPLARLAVLRLGAAEHWLLLVLHRAVADEPSVAILLDELSAHYAAAADGQTVRVALPPLPLQYADFAQWQRDRLPGSHRGPGPGPLHERQYRRLVDWWTSALTPVPPDLTLPVDRPRPLGPSPRGGIVRFDWGEDLARRVADAARAAGTTASTVLLAAFQCVLGRYGGEDRFAIGVPTTVRARSEFEGLVGPFTNLLALPADLSGRPTFRELLDRADRLVRAAGEHGELPFDHVVRALGVDRDPRRIPLCDAMFVSHQRPESEPRLPGAVVRRLPVHCGAVSADLTLHVERVEPEVAGGLEHRASMIDAGSARAMLTQLHTLLDAALANPGARVDELPMDPGGAARTRAPIPAPAAEQLQAGAAELPVHDLVRRQARRQPDAPAIWWDGAGVSYRELFDQAAAIAAGLRVLGVGGSAVVVRMPPGPRQIAALLGVFGAGAHLVWFATGDAGERGKAVLTDLRPACLLLDGDNGGDTGGNTGGNPAADELAEWYRRELDGLVVDVAALGGAGPGMARVGLDERAYAAYTSGSTGRPKGIPQTHAALAQFVTWMAAEFGMGPGSRVAQWVAPEHDPALCEVLAALVGGATLHPVPERIRRNPDKLVDWLVEERITVIQTVPSFARELLKSIIRRGAAGRLVLDRVLLMGEALPAELVDGLRAVLPDTVLVNLYGPTETIAATWHEITGSVAGTAPIGRPIPGRQVLLVDELDRPCPAGVTGEIVVRSPYVTPGYLGSQRGAAFRPLPGDPPMQRGYRTYRTGDLGRWRWDGALEFRGRKDFQVKLLGNRLELTEIEAALAEHESVLECAVVALTDGDGLAARLVAYVVPHRDPDGAPVAGPDAWRAHLRQRFGKAMLPALFKPLAQRLPRNVGGKVDRRRLPAPGLLLAQDARAPQSPVETGIAAIWSALLGTDRLTVEDTLFTAGGHSLLVPQLTELIRERFGVEVRPWEYFEHPTLAALAALVESAAAASEPATGPAGEPGDELAGELVADQSDRVRPIRPVPKYGGEQIRRSTA